MLKVSIILPIFNVVPYIERCLTSIYNQSYQNFEVIIIDDCGCDNSMDIVYSYLTPDKQSKTRIIHYDKNRGISAARNTGINTAIGDYLYFIDSDDYIHTDCLKTFTILAERYKYPDTIFGSATLVPKGWNKEEEITVNKKDIPDYCNKADYIRKSIFKSFIQSLSISQHIPIYVWNKFFKRTFIKKHMIYFQEGIIYEDLLWSWKIGNKITSIAFNKENTYYYTNCSNSITKKKYGIKNLDSETIIIKELLKSINYKYLALHLHYILHYAHSSYCRRFGDKRIEPCYIRYPKALLFIAKCYFNVNSI